MLGSAVISHHLRLLGILSVEDLEGDRSVRVRAVEVNDFDKLNTAISAARNGQIIMLQRPLPELLDFLDVHLVRALPGPVNLYPVRGKDQGQYRLRSFHEVHLYDCNRPHESIIVDDTGYSSWLWLPIGSGGILLLGTDLAGDLVRYRQGDPQQVLHRQTEPLWGIAGQRPNYLFDAQIEKGAEHDRQADWWTLTLAEAISFYLSEPLEPLLPKGAPGAIVITGDDDQAWLKKYEEQLEILDGLPMTYFLHPLTLHTPATLKRMISRNNVEVGLHPDALERPENYAELFHEQAVWFRKLTGQNAKLVRNHGFLNDGYWGHLPVWLDHNVLVSSNLPGLNGKVLNGSLLPARMVWNGQLTSHWSILTAIGDGIRFALGMDGPQSAQCIRALANRILNSKFPGVIVLNLHPQNVSETQDMHIMLHELVRDGFLPMTLSECVEWFLRRDHSTKKETRSVLRDGFFARISKPISRWGIGFQGKRN